MSAESNYSQIPPAPFADTVPGLVSAFLKCTGSISEVGLITEEMLQQMDALLSRYRPMESSLGTKRMRILATQSDLDVSRRAIKLLNNQKGESKITYELGDTLYGRAVVKVGERVAGGTAPLTVGLLLGAGVVVEYAAVDAISFLANKTSGQAEELRKCEHDLEFVRRQITTMEVGIARVYNHIVQSRRSMAPST